MSFESFLQHQRSRADRPLPSGQRNHFENIDTSRISQRLPVEAPRSKSLGYFASERGGSIYAPDSAVRVNWDAIKLEPIARQTARDQRSEAVANKQLSESLDARQDALMSRMSKKTDVQPAAAVSQGMQSRFADLSQRIDSSRATREADRLKQSSGQQVPKIS
ncbi:hypothetical protein OPU71_10280 [Niveibacterium sp. 24ML]|uniref:hypothetical protein n=1 Tax=Niveibacterium sp. 24ML TaxID=2985512 RepID=UPI0022700AF8|nr:hypothetical protein [Niveibacterium sp. 24ML]MCX9156508.1 hypothetical protein [Niveibacterium sp. 24ML]